MWTFWSFFFEFFFVILNSKFAFSGISSCYKNCAYALNRRSGSSWTNLSGLFSQGYWYKKKQEYYYFFKNMKVLQAGKFGLQVYGSHYSPYDNIVHNPIKIWNAYNFGMTKTFIYLFDVSQNIFSIKFLVFFLTVFRVRIYKFFWSRENHKFFGQLRF